MQISGLNKISLIDYPGKISAIVFTNGCNFRCSFCHNPKLIAKIADNNSKFKNYFEKNLEQFWNYINQKPRLIEAVVITGGEPTLQTGLIDFIKEIKKQDLLVKLDTNGSNPKTLEYLLQNNLINYVAMDIKQTLTKYPLAMGKNIDTDLIQQSINLLLQNLVDYEFRTTIVPNIHIESDFLEIGELIKGCKKYYLQKFNPTVTLKKINMENIRDFDYNLILSNLLKYDINAKIR